MLSKNHKQNSNFQITHFLVGACHTVDGAYSLLCDLKEEREASIKNYAVTQLKEKAKKLRAEKILKGGEADKLYGQAKLMELKNNAETGKILYEAALDELGHIEKCIVAINSLRLYADKTDLEAHELAQKEEWKYELIARAENHLLTTGTIPADHFATMRMHPAFKEVLLPYIQKIQSLATTAQGQKELMENISENKFDLPKLLK